MQAPVASAPEPTPITASPWRRFASPQALEAFGAEVAGRLRRGEAVCLFGPLGAGKSTLARGLVRALTQPDMETPSPTFTLMQTYEGRDFPVAHFDLYRLKRAEEAFEIGLDEALDVGAAVVEWSERLDGALPPDRLEVELAIEAADIADGMADLAHGSPAEGRLARWRGVGGWREKAVTLGR